MASDVRLTVPPLLGAGLAARGVAVRAAARRHVAGRCERRRLGGAAAVRAGATSSPTHLGLGDAGTTTGDGTLQG